MTCYVSYSFRPHLPNEEGSGTTMCPIASDIVSLTEEGSSTTMSCAPSDPASPLRRALVPLYVLQLQTPAPQ
jgi:hypothetical protein